MQNTCAAAEQARQTGGCSRRAGAATHLDGVPVRGVLPACRQQQQQKCACAGAAGNTFSTWWMQGCARRLLIQQCAGFQLKSTAACTCTEAATTLEQGLRHCCVLHSIAGL